MANLVSPCCGHEYSDHVDPDLNEYHQCNHCKEFFTEPEVDYEYAETQKEAKAEMEADERRDMGL